jgi:hypothetical protein
MRDQITLNNILKNNKAQPGGWGYGDIIVKKEFVENFIKEIIFEDFNIIYIGWWEYCSTMDTKNKIGMGGPKSIYFDGWFSEICLNFVYESNDHINITGNKIEKINKIMEHIRNIKFEGITFENSEILMPSFDLDVPDDWHNDIREWTLPD